MIVEFFYSRRKYGCSLVNVAGFTELRIRNEEGEVLAVRRGERHGLRGKTRATSRLVDLSEDKYYNLVKAAKNALDLTERDRWLKEKEEYIQLLHSEVTLLKNNGTLSEQEKQELANLREAIVQMQQSSTLPDFLEGEEHICERIKRAIGEKAWLSLHHSSRRDLVNAHRQRKLVESDAFTESFSDFKPACLYLSSLVEREIAQRFFHALKEFVACQGLDLDREIGGMVIRQGKQYTLGRLPRLLASEWTSMREDVLISEKPDRGKLWFTYTDDRVSEADRKLVQDFLAQWNDPLSLWLKGYPQATSTIDSLSKLRNLTAHTQPMHKWHFLEFWLYVVGGNTKSGRSEMGILRQIFSGEPLGC